MWKMKMMFYRNQSQWQQNLTRRNFWILWIRDPGFKIESRVFLVVHSRVFIITFFWQVLGLQELLLRSQSAVIHSVCPRGINSSFPIQHWYLFCTPCLTKIVNQKFTEHPSADNKAGTVRSSALRLSTEHVLPVRDVQNHSCCRVTKM